MGQRCGESLALLLLLVSVTIASGQGITPDADGHCLIGSNAVFSCWNFHAGQGLGEDIANYSEFLPNLHGWDFRINLPHTNFQIVRHGAGTSVTMTGVIEDSGPLYNNPTTLVDYGHRSNAIWLFRQEASSVFFAMVPSRRDRASSQTENIFNLTGGWLPIGGAPNPLFQSFRLASATVGSGIGSSTVHVVAIDNGFQLWHNQIAVNSAHIASWSSPWMNLSISSHTAPDLVAAGNFALALAWIDPSKRLMVRLFNVASGIWGLPVVVAAQADLFRPHLLWDGASLNVLFSRGDRLYHSFGQLNTNLTFSTPTIVSSFLPVYQGEFDAIVFNGGIHVAVRTRTGNPINSAVFYTNTTSPLDSTATWTIPSDTGLQANDVPRIGTLYENVFVIVPNLGGRVTYARKVPNSVDNRITGGALADHWLEPGAMVDPFTRGAGPLSGLEVLSFNSDLYLTANQKAGFVDGSSQILNFGRAAMKQLLRAKWGMNLMYGDGPEVLDRTPFGGPDEIRMTGDFNGDLRTDVIRFTQKNIDGVGPAPVYVRRVVGTPQTAAGFSDEEVWHKFFSLKGEIPMVGDFNGDGKTDIITFAQEAQFFSDGTLIGPAPVWVAISNGSSFNTSSVWHNFFSLKDEIPLVGDFNGDGKTDIITFTQKAQFFSDGTLIGPAPVWVALSNGTSFNTSSVWHKFFSLKGEIPMVGDFNGDGKDDIATFVQQPQFDAAGNLIGHAPVWVALSNGHGFDASRIWHTYFSAHGEVPRVADINMDGKDDIITFLQGTGSGIQARNVYVAFSTGSRFETSTMFASDQVNPGEVPYFGSFSGVPLGRITGQSSDSARFFPDLYIFRPSGPFAIAHAMGRIPFQTGAPWERYKWFPEKAIGAAQFPEWIYETGPNHCLTSPFRFILGGLGGSGGAVTMVSSVRTGARAPHILQELGHALFANCMRVNLDPFGLFNLIFATPMDAGGLDANNMPGCGGFDDCRDPEHFFLGLMVEYRSFGDEFRQSINSEPDPAVKDRRRKQYLWLKSHWYKGAEFKRGIQSDVSLFVDGVLCLPGECSLQ